MPHMNLMTGRIWLWFGFTSDGAMEDIASSAANDEFYPTDFFAPQTKGD